MQPTGASANGDVPRGTFPNAGAPISNRSDVKERSAAVLRFLTDVGAVHHQSPRIIDCAVEHSKCEQTVRSQFIVLRGTQRQDFARGLKESRQMCDLSLAVQRVGYVSR